MHGTLVPVKATNAPARTRLRSTWARAVVPVVGGMAAIAAIMGFTWLLAAYLSGGGGQPSELLAPTRLELGSVRSISESVAQDGPLLIQDLGTVDGDRAIVVDHTGDDPALGWRVYYAFPAGRPDCPVTQIEGTRRFLDCDGAELAVESLSPPLEAVRPVVEQRRTLYIDLSAFRELDAPPTTG